MADSYVSKDYLQTQFQNYSNVVKNTFAKKVDIIPEKIEYETSVDPTITNAKEALDKAMDINVDTLGYENDVDATIDNVRGALDKLMTKTDSELEAPLTPNVVMGTLKASYPKGTPLEEIIRDMLTEKIAPKVVINLSPSTTLYDAVTGSISSLTINATVTKQTYDVAKIEYYINDTLVKSNTNCANGGSYPYIHNTAIDETVVIKVVATDKEGMSNTATKTITFVPNSYYGILDASTGEVTESIIKTLNKTLKTTKSYTYEGITTDWGKVCYCYPKSFGELTSIKDPVNSLNYTSEFSKTTINVDGFDMYCYVKIEPSSADNVTLSFA